MKTHNLGQVLLLFQDQQTLITPQLQFSVKKHGV